LTDRRDARERIIAERGSKAFSRTRTRGEQEVQEAEEASEKEKKRNHLFPLPESSWILNKL
jgi:hypothetical protein